MANSRLGLRSHLGSIKNITFGNRSYDVDALAFIDYMNTIGTLTALQQSAINNLVKDLKGIGSNNSTIDFWTSKITRFWPMVGGTAAMHSIDLRNPYKYNLRFYNSVTHSSLGVVVNGSNYFSTGINSLYDWGQNNCHFGIYFQSTVVGYNFGTIGSSRTHINPSFYCLNDNELGSNSLTSSANGHHIITRTSSTAKAAYRNGAANGTSTATSVAGADQECIAGGILLSGVASLQNANTWSCFHIGSGLTSGQAAILYTIIQAYQTSLSRNV